MSLTLAERPPAEADAQIDRAELHAHDLRLDGIFLSFAHPIHASLFADRRVVL